MKKEFSSSDYKNPEALVYISCLPASTTEQTVHKLFSQWVKIRSLEISRYKSPPYHCRGYAVLECHSPKEARQLISMKTISYEDVFIKVGEFYDNDKISEITRGLKIRRIFIKNLPVDSTDRMLYRFFSAFGELEKAYCVKKKKKRFKFGYVIFKDVESISYIPENDLKFYDGTSLKWKWTGKKESSDSAGREATGGKRQAVKKNTNQGQKGERKKPDRKHNHREQRTERHQTQRRGNKTTHKRGSGRSKREVISPDQSQAYPTYPPLPANQPHSAQYFPQDSPTWDHQDRYGYHRGRVDPVSCPHTPILLQNRGAIGRGQAQFQPFQSPGWTFNEDQPERRIRPRLFEDMQDDYGNKPTTRKWFELNFEKLTRHFFETDGGENYRLNKPLKKKLKKIQRKAKKIRVSSNVF